MTAHPICDACETVAHCSRNGCIPAVRNGGRTGSPPGLLQDDCKALSRWLASRPDARRIVRMVLAELDGEGAA